MNTELEKQLDALIGKISNKEDFDQVKEQLLKRGIESLLKAEMTAHLGYQKGASVIESNQRNGFSEKTIKTQNGEQRIKIPRDRQASFEPVIVPKHQSISQELEDCIQLLYAKGMSNSDIIDFIESTYGVQYSTSQVSIITNQLLEDIKQWQNRPLEDVYPIVWIDAIHYKIRQEGKVISKACMIVLGVNTEGQQDILSMSIVETEKAAAWMSILDDLRSRGVKDIFFLCSDNLSGLDKAVEAIFPGSIRQICIVHQIRNSLKYVSYKDRKPIMVDIKAIYQADNEKFALEAFEVFKQNWQDKYLSAVQSWENNWDNLTTFLNYPKEIRQLIYTTNIIESFNASLRKYTRNKKVFPHDDAALKSIYLAAQSISKKWKKTRFKWGQIYNQLYICFPNRL
ncbi:IS256 family transposase [Arenibacter sp. GZD96]|uniref:IS256 family transposase n=1 Tax=Aurantibrevibacter litoralis TaxID=3106030 RepID=UPI002AFF2144|nr:IS256 family transposase [Arenibacter sp. GZD-96]MEA1787628.1 IS256 family transposase [Arenibacter sp. GZD-96]